MGHLQGPESMAAAFLKSAGVRQMMGYVEVTWYGYMGWGCLDYFIEQPGRYSFTEAFFANHHALIHRLESCFPGSNGAILALFGPFFRPAQKYQNSLVSIVFCIFGLDGCVRSWVSCCQKILHACAIIFVKISCRTKRLSVCFGRFVDVLKCENSEFWES